MNYIKENKYFSSATLPVTIQCLVEKNGVDPNLAKFMVPIGAGEKFIL